MGIKKYTAYTPSRRNMTGSDFSEITKTTPEKSLTESLKKNAGRNNQGRITVRHHGGGNRRKYRLVAATEENTDWSISEESRTASLQRSSELSTIPTELQTSL